MISIYGFRNYININISSEQVYKLNSLIEETSPENSNALVYMAK